MGIKRASAKQKGKQGENEICKMFNERYDLDIDRRYNQALGGADIHVLGLCIEVKRREQLNIRDWWEQVIKASELTKRIPVLAYRQNNKPWTFCLCGNLLGLSPLSRITLDKDTFLAWVDLHHQYLSDLENSFG